MTDRFTWIITQRGAANRPVEYQTIEHRGEIGVRRHDGNRPLRPYYVAGPLTPEDSPAFRSLAAAKAEAEAILRKGGK
jgi:hypothetical protein